MTQEAAQILLRTAQRWYKIRHLEPDTRKSIMAMSEDDFEIEFQKLSRKD